jgi:predicted small lipoprotein YifL
MKRITTLLAVFMILVMIAGCGAKNTATQDKSEPAEETTETQKTNDPQEAAETHNNDGKVSVYRLVSEYDNTNDTEVMVLEHQYGKENKEAEIVYKFGNEIKQFAKIMDVSEDKILIKQGSYLYVFNLESKELTLLNEGAIDCNIDNGVIYYYDKDNTEFSIEDWANEPEPKATGNEVVSYATNVPENIEVNFPDFSEIQKSAREGKERPAYDAGYTIESNGDMYSLVTGKYVTNINLPKAVCGNSFNCYDTIFFVENNQIDLYFFGESIFNYKLPEGKWKVVAASLDYEFEDEDLTEEMTADVMKKSLTEIEVMLYNRLDNSLWVCHGEDIEKIATDVLDFFSDGYGIYYIDKDYCPYVGSFNYIDRAGDPVIGVSHFEDNPGFIVDDERGKTMINGLSIWTF